MLGTRQRWDGQEGRLPSSPKLEGALSSGAASRRTLAGARVCSARMVFRVACASDQLTAAMLQPAQTWRLTRNYHSSIALTKLCRVRSQFKYLHGL